MSVVDSFKERIAAYQKLKKEVVDDLSKDFKGFVETVLKETGCPFLSMRGFTPSWCDGDVCEFTLYTNEDGVKAILEHFDDVDFSNFDATSKSTAKKVSKIFSELEDILEPALHFNFEVLAGIDVDGNFHYHLNPDYDYDCGY